MTKLLVTVAFIALAQPAHAAEGMLLGAGTNQCRAITELYRKSSPGVTIQMADLLVGSWASGFMSAVNMTRSMQGKDTQNLAALTTEDQVIAIRRYCKHNPDNTMMQAVMDMYSGFSSNVDASE